MKYMTYGLWCYCWPNTPMAVSEAFVEIRKGRDKLGPRRMGVVETFNFKVSQAT